MASLRGKLLRISLWDGIGLLVMGFGSLAAASIWRDPVGAMVGAALVTLGGIELRGRRMLQEGNPRATGWLVSTQVGLMLVILSYGARSLAHPPTINLSQVPPELLMNLEALPAGDLNSMIRPMVQLVYWLLMLVSVIYQGNMAVYYLRKTPLALAKPPPLPPV